MFSTMTRMSAPSNRKLELVDSLLRCLPLERSVVMLHTPPDLIGLRSKAGPIRSSENFSRKKEELDYIFQQQKDFGIDTIELDRSLSVYELCLELSAQINNTSEG